MGVSITAYKNIKFLAKEIDWDNIGKDEIGLYKVGFDRSDGFSEGTYSFTDEFTIMSKSYGGYNIWRNNLCGAVHSFQAQYLWDHREFEGFQALAFYELIDFSDCEGFLGPYTCSKLLADFKGYEEDLKISEVDYVDEWIIGLEMVAGNGVVKFS